MVFQKAINVFGVSERGHFTTKHPKAVPEMIGMSIVANWDYYYEDTIVRLGLVYKNDIVLWDSWGV